jgi:hypothetical protein
MHIDVSGESHEEPLLADANVVLSFFALDFFRASARGEFRS